MFQKEMLKKMQILAKKRNGKCLSSKYINAKTKLEWQCNICNYKWEATPSNIQQGKWCPYCAGNAPKTIEYIQELAEKNGGKCLSIEYINANAKYKWQCDKGHVWEADYSSIQKGHWCPYCYGNTKYTIEHMIKLANIKNGKCISCEYINSQTKLKWQCEKGHIWEAKPNKIIQGKWCPYCAGFHKTIKNMQMYAKKKKGKCISQKYIDAHTRLIWECEFGHQWDATPANILRGYWCPYCKNKSEQKFRDVIEEYFNVKFPKRKPKWLINQNGNRLELDGYNEKLGIAFEYQGKQHFQPIYNNFFGGKKALTKRRKHDSIKKQLCKEKNIILLCPTYELDESEYEEFIKKNINS